MNLVGLSLLIFVLWNCDGLRYVSSIHGVFECSHKLQTHKMLRTMKWKWTNIPFVHLVQHYVKLESIQLYWNLILVFHHVGPFLNIQVQTFLWWVYNFIWKYMRHLAISRPMMILLCSWCNCIFIVSFGGFLYVFQMFLFLYAIQGINESNIQTLWQFILSSHQRIVAILNRNVC